MALENASFVNQLVASNPVSTDSVAQADDHLRLIKAVLTATFPNLNAPVTATPAQINSLTGTNVVPSGFIGIWSGSAASIPSGWLLCDGTNGTPNLRDRFVVGAGTSYAVAATGGSKDAIVPEHTHTATSAFVGSAMAAHSHTLNDAGHTHTYAAPSGAAAELGTGYTGTSGIASSATTTSGSSTTGISVESNSAGTPSGSVFTTVASAGISVTNANLPPYYALCYIMKA